jgi:tetratricopeptide (TPR) repeat protein
VVEEIESALKLGNYAEAMRLVQTLDPQEPRTQLYLGQIQEALKNWEQAEQTYRFLLRENYSSKITLAARQGLERLQADRTEDRQQAISQAIAAPEKTELGVLILKAMPLADKTEAAKQMSQIMNIDPYSARMLLPSKGLRLYRAGAIGELEYYGQQLQARGIPAFWTPLSTLQSIPVYKVSYFESIGNPAHIVVSSDHTPQKLQFSWSDVTQRVEGQLPIFEEVVDRDTRGKLRRKEQTQDHAQFCDLHLPKQNCILRLYDIAYQFNQGISLENPTEAGHSLDQKTSWSNWRHLSQTIAQKLPQQPIFSDFEYFAETALDHPDLLSKVSAHINLFRREESDWDPAFHLYSTVLFLS